MSRPRAALAWLLALLLALPAATALGADTDTKIGALEILPLRHRLAADVLPVLRPLLAEGGSLSGADGQLFVRTTPANLAELRDVLAVIDRPYRMLEITVRQDLDQSLRERELALSGRAGSDGLQAEVRDPGRGGASVQAGGEEAELRLRGAVRDTEASSRNDHRVRTLEGQPALIFTGLSQPYPSESLVLRPDGVVVRRSVEYHDSRSGVYVVPRLSGDRVTLEVSPRLERPGAPGGAIDTQRIDTVVSGRLGEWIELGLADQQETAGRSTELAAGRAGTASQRRVWVKVEALP